MLADLFHLANNGDDLDVAIASYANRVAHVQIAGVPDRHEPDEGELRVEYLLGLLDELGYQGHVGCEYRPRRGAVAGGTSAGLGWLN